VAYFENPGRYRAGQRSLRGLSKRTIPFHCLGNVRDIRRLRMAHIFNNLRKIAAVMGQKLLFRVTAGWEKLFSFSKNPVLC